MTRLEIRARHQGNDASHLANMCATKEHVSTTTFPERLASISTLFPESSEDFPESSELLSINTILQEDHVELTVADRNLSRLNHSRAHNFYKRLIRTNSTTVGSCSGLSSQAGSYRAPMSVHVGANDVIFVWFPSGFAPTALTFRVRTSSVHCTDGVHFRACRCKWTTRTWQKTNLPEGKWLFIVVVLVPELWLIYYKALTHVHTFTLARYRPWYLVPGTR